MRNHSLALFAIAALLCPAALLADDSSPNFVKAGGGGISGDAQGNVISDVIGGLGLPGGRHVCYDLVFRERTAGGGTGGGTGGGGTGGSGAGDLTAQLQRIEEKLDSVLAHLGIGG